MKVCIISSLYPPYERGGAEVVAAEQAKKMSAAGDDIFIITTKPWQGFESLCYRLENQAGIRVYRFYPLNTFSFININKKTKFCRLFWNLIDVFNLHSYCVIKRILKKEKPELVLTHNVKGLGYLTWRAVKNLGIKNIHTLHDVQLIYPSGLLKVGEERKLDGWFCRLYISLCCWLVGSPAEVISPSEWLLNLYLKRHFFPVSAKKTVDLAFGQLPPVAKLNLTPQKEIINLLYVGQIEKHKGICWLIHRLKKGDLKIQELTGREGLTIKDFKLDIVGDGSILDKIRQKVSGDKRFKVWGYIPKENLGDFFTNTDFTVVPSLVYENSPTIIPESLKHGVPVIASRIGGIPEVIVEGVNGWFLNKVFENN